MFWIFQSLKNMTEQKVVNEGNIEYVVNVEFSNFHCSS